MSEPGLSVPVLSGADLTGPDCAAPDLCRADLGAVDRPAADLAGPCDWGGLDLDADARAGLGWATADFTGDRTSSAADFEPDLDVRPAGADFALCLLMRDLAWLNK